MTAAGPNSRTRRSRLSAPRRALIVGTDRDRGALTAARSLRRAGWEVGVGTPDGRGMLAATRAATDRHRVPRPRGDAGGFLDGVRRAVAEGSYDVVFGADDDSMAALCAYRHYIPTPVAHPGPDVVAAGLDKVGLAERATRAGLAVARTVPATDEALAAWQGPVVVSCGVPRTPGMAWAPRIEAEFFADAGSAAAQVRRVRAAGADPVLQAPLRGRPGALIGVQHDGRLHGRVQQVTSRLRPGPDRGSARAQTVPVDEELAARAETLLRELGWWGLVELQFRSDDEGTAHLVDLNGRFPGSMALAEAARPGLCDAWGRLALGDSVPPLPDARTGVRCAWLAEDLLRASSERRGGLAADVVDTLRWGRGAQHSVWDPQDPGPVWHLATGRFRRGTE